MQLFDTSFFSTALYVFSMHVPRSQYMHRMYFVVLYCVWILRTFNTKIYCYVSKCVLNVRKIHTQYNTTKYIRCIYWDRGTCIENTYNAVEKNDVSNNCNVPVVISIFLLTMCISFTNRTALFPYLNKLIIFTILESELLFQ